MEEMNGKKVSAKRVFRLAIKFLKKHLLDQFKERNLGVNNDLIKWVITVPAIWNDACKQFMREAAEGVRTNKTMKKVQEHTTLFRKKNDLAD